KLVCGLKSCNKTISSSQPTIHCWLCENVLHAKCAGFTASVSDAISRRSGLHFCCDGCRAVQDEMRSFMRQTKSGFKELVSGFRKINDQLCALDTQFSSLQLLNDINEQFSDMSSVASLQVIPPDPIIETPLKVTEQGNQASGPPVRTDAAILVTAAPKPLQVIPPSKHIFVSRLAPDTSEIELSAYIKAKSKADIKVADITKFKYNYTRHTSSFKIRVPAQMFKTICSASFWPENIFVQE
ncbi:hypothetical protein KR067_012942, partial [Drosophila pandora]